MRRTVQNAKRSPDRRTRGPRHGSSPSAYSGIALSLLVVSINRANLTGVSDAVEVGAITAIDVSGSFARARRQLMNV